MPGEKLLTITQAARELGIHPNTLRAWVDKGLVPAVILPSGYRRFSRSQIAAIRAELGMTTDAEPGSEKGKAAA